MFNVRFGYYLGAICIFPIILWYDGIKNTLFRKNNTRLHILSGMIGILIITLPAIFLIFNLPPTYNRIIKTVTGEVVKRQCIGTGYLNGLAAYSIILDDKDTNKIYNFPDVIGIENELKKGDEIEIYLYEFYGAQSRIITKVNGKELYYVKQDHPFNKTLEKIHWNRNLKRPCYIYGLLRISGIRTGRKKKKRKRLVHNYLCYGRNIWTPSMDNL